MEAVLKSDVFFFVTTICIVLVTILFVVIAIYSIRIFSDVNYLVKKARKEGEEIIDDVKTARTALKEKGKNIFSLLNSFSILRRSRQKKK